jgi:hypothetical protein
MTREWIQSNGGPLLLLPSELLQQWRGTATSDYERACAVDDEVAALDVGTGVGLVLGDEPHQTSWATADEGGLLVRWVYADDESDVWAAVDNAEDADFELTNGADFVVGASGRCVLLDSADPGDDLRSEHLEVSLAPGAYLLSTATLAPSEKTRVLVHRLRRRAGQDA